MTELHINLKLAGNIMGNFQVGGSVEANGGRLEQAVTLCSAVRDLLDTLEMPWEDFTELYRLLQCCDQQCVVVNEPDAAAQEDEDT